MVLLFLVGEEEPMKLTEKQAEVIRKIIYAVETGGQEYGKCRYNDFTPAYANASSEHAITIGAGQWYGNEAKELLKEILSAAPEVFRKHDTAGIEKDLSKSWSAYRISKSSAKAKAIVAIINTPEGKKAQDAKMDAQMLKYINEAEALGVKDVAAAMMCANFRHQGGKTAPERILKKTKKPYTLDHLYSACKTDTGNQVGNYRSRQKKVYNWLKDKVEKASTETQPETKTEVKKETKKEVSNVGVTAKQIIDTMESWVGLDRAKGTHKPILKIYNDYIKAHKGAGRNYIVQPSDAFCDTTVSAAFIKNNAVDLIGGVECSCENHIALFKKKGIWKEDGTLTPEPGWIILYNWDDKTQPNDGRADHIGIVKSVDKENKIFVVTEGNKGGKVDRRTVPFKWGCIRGFAVPKYAEAKESTSKATKATEKAPESSQKAAKNSKEVAFKEYTVKKGDTLKSIAKAKKTTVQVLVDLNKISNVDKIKEGQKIKYPTSGDFFKGCRVRVKRTAKKYATGQSIASFVKGSEYKVTKVKSDRCLLSKINSWVKKEDLILL